MKRRVILSLAGSAVLAFGMYHIHAQSGVTEGGTLGLTLLLYQWFSLSPAITGFLLNGCCYLLGIRTFGRSFLLYSILCSAGFSAVYGICEQFPPLWPGIAEYPAAAAVIGGLFVGVGVGLCVRAGGAPTGDDALAMSISKRTGCPIERIYLITDLTVLALSLSYIPFSRIVWSLVTVVLSGKIIGIIQRFQKPTV